MKRKHAFRLLFAGWVALLATLRGAEAPRTAVLDFVRAGALGSMEPGLADYSRAVQAKLLANADYAWIERQELERLMEEANRTNSGGGDTATAVRLGNLLRADLLLRGEISPTETGAEVKLEVIDLKRADLLAVRRSPVTIDKSRRLMPDAAQIEAAASAALAALAEGRSALERTAGLRVIAPLYIKNTSRTRRLDYLEEKLSAALGQTAVSTNGFHLLRFPQTAAAGSEAELVLGGLTDTDPDAWQHVADAYIWATVEEKGRDGDVFETVPVVISVQVWNGFGPPQETRWEGPVRDLDQGVDTVMARALAAAKPAPAGAQRDVAERDRIADSLVARANELQARIKGSQFGQGTVARGVSSEDFANSAEGRQLVSYRQQLIEIACFLKPLDKKLAEIGRQGRSVRGRVDSYSLSAVWERLKQAQHSEKNPDGSINENGAVQLNRCIEELRQAVSWNPKPVWYKDGPALSREEIQQQRQQVEALWLEHLQGTIALRRTLTGPPPPWLAKITSDQVGRLPDFLARIDTIRARRTLEQLWPALKPEIGRMLRGAPTEDGESTGFTGAGLVKCVLGIYDAFGDIGRGIEMLDEAWNAFVPAKPPADAAQPAKSTGKPPTPQRTWTSKGRAPGVAALQATIREIELWPKVYLRQERNVPDAPLHKQVARIVDEMAWHQGRLWIAETGRFRLSAELGLKNPEGDHFLWSYDPALRLAEFATSRLVSHTTIRALLSQAENLWLGFDGAGLWRWNPDAPATEPRRFKGEDGLITQRIRQAQAEPGALYFLGGEFQKPALIRYDLATGNWLGMEALISGGTVFANAAPRPRSMAFFGDWLGFADGEPMFYNTATKEWKRLARPLIIPPGVRVGEPPRFYASAISADEGGFWLGRENMLRLLDPRAPEKQHDLALPGYPVAMAHSGHWLWVLLEDKAPLAADSYLPGENRTATRLALVDKRSFGCVGVLTLPAQDMRKIVVAAGRVWVGGTALLEVIPVLPEEPAPQAGPPALKDLPLHRAAWAGDATGVEAQLTTKAAVDQTAPGGWTPLMAGVDGGHIDIVRRLLAAGADPNATTADGTSALLVAAQHADEGLVQTLFAAGATPEQPAGDPISGLETSYPPIAGPLSPGPLNQPTKQTARLKAADVSKLPDWSDRPGWIESPAVSTFTTPLMVAAKDGSTSLVKILLERGARPDGPDNCGRTALLLAARHGQDETARLLLAHGARPDCADLANETPVMAAYLRHDNLPLFREMLGALAGEPKRQAASQIMFEAAKTGQTADLELLRSLGGDIQAAWTGGESLLRAALQVRQQDTVLWLISQGIKFPTGAQATDARRSIIHEILDTIMRTGNAAALEKMIEAGMDINGDYGSLPLLAWAASENQLEIATMLKARGADLGRKTRENKTPLDYAQTDEMRQLLGGKTGRAWSWPERGDYRRGTRVQRRTSMNGVVQKEADPSLANRKLLSACQTSNFESARQAVAEGATPDCWDETGMTPLCHALSQKNGPLVRWLVENGATVDFATRSANFPLSFAAENNLPDMVDFLLSAGADVNAHGEGSTALMAVAPTGNTQMAQKLLSAGADPNLCGGGVEEWRHNPLARALDEGDKRMADMLLAAGANPKAGFDLYYQRFPSGDPRRRAPTLLMFAAEGGKVELIRQMISLGQDPKLRSENGDDALTWAAGAGKKEAVEFLLPLSEHKGRALEAAQKKGHTAITQILQRAGYQ